jgi:hypothetical protein
MNGMPDDSPSSTGSSGAVEPWRDSSRREEQSGIAEEVGDEASSSGPPSRKPTASCRYCTTNSISARRASSDMASMSAPTSRRTASSSSVSSGSGSVTHRPTVRSDGRSCGDVTGTSSTRSTNVGAYLQCRNLSAPKYSQHVRASSSDALPSPHTRSGAPAASLRASCCFEAESGNRFLGRVS